MEPSANPRLSFLSTPLPNSLTSSFAMSISNLSFSLQPSAAPHHLLSADRSPKLLKCHNKSGRMGLLASHKALRSTPFRKRKRNNYTHKLNTLPIITSFSSTGDPPATPFNSTTFLMELQQLRDLEKAPYQLKFDQYGSMDNLLACWPLAEPPPNQADFINHGYDTIHEDVLFPSSSPTAISGDYYAISEHGVIAGSSCDSIVQKTRVYDQECSSKDVLSSGSIPVCCGDNSSLHSVTLERQMEGSEVLYFSSDQIDGQNSGVCHSL